jgi:hypothetical protein
VGGGGGVVAHLQAEIVVLDNRERGAREEREERGEREEVLRRPQTSSLDC